MAGASAPTMSFAFFWDLNSYQYSGSSPCTDSIGTSHYQFHDGGGYTDGDDDCYSANGGAHYYNTQLSNGCYSWPGNIEMNITTCNAFTGAYTPAPTPARRRLSEVDTEPVVLTVHISDGTVTNASSFVEATTSTPDSNSNSDKYSLATLLIAVVTLLILIYFCTRLDGPKQYQKFVSET